jgi:hypothetical protein
MIATLINSSSTEEAAEFARNFATEANRLLSQSVWIEDVQYAELTPLRNSARSRFMGFVEGGDNPFAAPVAAAAAAAAAVAMYFANGAARITSVPPPLWSSVCLTLRASEQSVPYPARFAREAADKRAGREIAMQRPTSASHEADASMADLETSPIWRDDPRQAAKALACYRFVASLMGFRHDVAELGCASPLGTRLALQQFRRITLFDPREIAVRDLSWRFRDNWRFEARVHNILAAPLPRKVDSAYSIEFLQYLSKDEEDTFVSYLRDSLSRDFDFVVIGSPCYQPRTGEIATGLHARSDARSNVTLSPTDAGAVTSLQQTGNDTSSAVAVSKSSSPAELRLFDPKAARIAPRIYLRTAEELKALMDRHFHSVFIFSMIDDDVVLPGLDSRATHIFALGCGK